MTKLRAEGARELFCPGCRRMWIGLPGSRCPNPFINNGCDGYLMEQKRSESKDVELQCIESQAEEELHVLIGDMGFEARPGKKYRITVEEL